MNNHHYLLNQYIPNQYMPNQYIPNQYIPKQQMPNYHILNHNIINNHLYSQKMDIDSDSKANSDDMMDIEYPKSELITDKYLKFYYPHKIIFFMVEIIKDKTHTKFSKLRYNYYINIKDLSLSFQSNQLDYQYPITNIDNLIDNQFDISYNGIFLRIDSDKKIKLYDNIKKVYISNRDFVFANKITYLYNGKVSNSLDNIIQEIIYSMVIN